MPSANRFLVAAVLGGFLVAACSSGGPDDAPASARDLSQIKQKGELRVVTRNAPTTFYLDRDTRKVGPEYDMVKAFADDLGLEVKLLVADSVSEVLETLKAGKADLAAAGLTITEQRKQHLAFGPGYQEVRQQVVCRQKGKKARKVEQLQNVDLTVIKNSSYVARLQALQKDHPELTWKTSDLGTEQLLGQVWEQTIDCTVADSNIVDVNRRYYPELIVTFDLSKPQSLAWAMPGDAQALHKAVNKWFKDYEKAGGLADIQETYYGFITEFDYVDKKKLRDRIDSRYVKYNDLFEKAADKHGVPVGLLAAQGYQESHWDPKAKSPTGVRGIMMLTKPTARELGVQDRLDPAQSIAGGARYLQNMQKRLDEEIGYPDRTYFALAAYNVGLAHLRDAQKLTKQLGKDPHAWTDVRTVLPLLSDKRYYSKLKYGYARGSEPVRYVNRIRDYEDVIAKHTE